jgi:hypothetical protein
MNKLVIALLGLCLSVGCATTPPPVQMTPLQLQALQQREFEATKTIAFQSVLSVFQDAGYTIDQADLESGFITASSASEAQVDWLFTGNTYSSQTRATATIEEGAQGIVRIRLNFVTGTQTSTGYGQSMQRDRPILEPATYQAAFERIENAIFMRSASTPGAGASASAPGTAAPLAPSASVQLGSNVTLPQPAASTPPQSEMGPTPQPQSASSTEPPTAPRSAGTCRPRLNNRC